MFRAHVEAGFESAHANGPVGHKCSEMHGHSWVAEIDLSYYLSLLDEFGWGPDFGALKGFIKALDHHDLATVLPSDLPPSAENIARHLWMQVVNAFPRVFGVVVTVHEGSGNRVSYDGVD